MAMGTRHTSGLMLRVWILLVLLCWASLPVAALAEEPRADGPIDAGASATHADAAKVAASPRIAATTRESICLLIEAAASANGLPVEFFARLIWQESRFDAEAVGPRTRSGERALGIARGRHRRRRQQSSQQVLESGVTGTLAERRFESSARVERTIE